MELKNICVDVLKNINFGLILCKIIRDNQQENNYLIEDANETFASFVHKPIDSIIGQSANTLLAKHHNHLPQFIYNLNKIAEDHEPFHYDWPVNDHSIWYRLSVTCPKADYLLITCQEITADMNSLLQCETQLALEERHKARYEALIKLMRNQYTSKEVLLCDALTEALQLTNSEIGYIYHYSDEKKSFIYGNWSRSEAIYQSIDQEDTLFHQYDTTTWEKAENERKPIVVNHFEPTSSDVIKSPLTNYLSVPVFDGDSVVAVICVANKPSHYDQFDIYQVTLLMNNIWGVAKNLMAQEKLAYISYHDQLTGLYNRYFFELEIARLDHSRHLPMAIIIGDVNGLKLTNDVFGHIEGDNILKYVSKSIKEVCRDEDIIARWGGDEFILLLPATNSEGAASLCNRITESVNRINQLVINPSISLGYSIKSDPDESLNDHLKKAEDEMYRMKLHESQNQRNRIIDSMRQNLYEKSHETEKHAKRLVKYSQAIAEKLGLSDTQINDLKLFAYLHDIGKVGIPDNVLKKTNALDQEEWSLMKRHPEIGYRIAQATPELSTISEFILYHHERYDGNGYPKGLKANAIPLASRIIAVVDAFDAMTSNRPYSKPISKVSALNEIKACCGSQFDPDVVHAFLDIINDAKSDYTSEMPVIL